jgi:hypothetical protein
MEVWFHVGVPGSFFGLFASTVTLDTPELNATLASFDDVFASLYFRVCCKEQ